MKFILTYLIVLQSASLLSNVIKLRPYKMMVLKIMSKNANNRKQLELKSEI